MRILALSDINWSPRKAGADLQELIALVEQVQPELVLLAGDLVDNDKRVNRERWLPYWRDLISFFDVLDAKHIPGCFVQGNWDEVPEYDVLAARTSTGVQEISGRTVTVNGVRLFGIPHAVTARRTTLRDLTTTFTEPVDIVLTHAEGQRRMRLFELPTKLIITGHYDQKVSAVLDKGFLAFQNYPGQYAVLDYQPDEIGITYYYGRLDNTLAQYSAEWRDGKLTWKTPPPDHWVRYGQHMEALLALKDRLPDMDAPEKRAAIQGLLDQGVYKAHILEYIPGSAALMA